MRSLIVCFVLVGIAASAEPVKPTIIELKSTTLGEAINELNQLAGDTRKVPEDKKNLPFQSQKKATYWQAVRAIEQASGKKTVAADDGPFRLELKKVLARKEIESNYDETELTFELQWEPKVPVMLTDAEPTVIKADILRAAPVFIKPSGKILPRNDTQQIVLKATGIPRVATSVGTLQLAMEVVAARNWLNFEFAELEKTTDTKAELNGVTAIFHPMKSKEKRTEFSLSLTYPKDHPEFESFQQWAVGNRLRLISPDGSKVVDCHTDDSSVDTDGRSVRAVYSFPKSGPRALTSGDWKGWRIRYSTPGPMVTQKLSFTFNDVPLP